MNNQDEWEWEPFLNFEKDHNLPIGFFNKLYIENDWSFIIKIHSLIESISSSLLVYHFQEPSLKKIISQLEMSNIRTGKIAFLKSTDLLGESEIKFILTLSQLRNNLVHKIENISFSFSDWIGAMDKNQLKQYSKLFSPETSTLIRLKKKSDERKKKGLNYIEIEVPDLNSIYERFKSNTKLHIWIGLYHLLVSISEGKNYSNYLQSKKYSKFIYEYEEYEYWK